jgi:hypothetical protein
MCAIFLSNNSFAQTRTSLLNSIQLDAGFQQNITLDGALNTFDYLNLQSDHHAVLLNQPIIVSGRLQVISGNIIMNNSGLTIQFDKAALKKRVPVIPTNPIKNNSANDSLNVILNQSVPNLPNKSYTIEEIKGNINKKLIELDTLQSFNKNITLPKLEIPSISAKDSIYGTLRFDTINYRVPNIQLENSVNKTIEDNQTIKLKRIKDFSLGLSSLNISELIGKGISYQGGSINLSLSKDASIRLSTGMTNRLPSLNELLRNPSALTGISSNNNLINSFSNSAQLTNSILINRDIINLTSSNYFGGIEYKKNLGDGFVLSINHYYIQSSKNNEIDLGSSNLTSVDLFKTHKSFSFGIEIANSQHNVEINKPLAKNDSSTINLTPIALAPAFKAELTGKVSNRVSINMHYRNLTNSFYSPIARVNNNLIDNLQLGVIYQSGILKSETFIANSKLRIANDIIPSKSIGENINVKLGNFWRINANVNYSLFQDSSKRANTFNGLIQIVSKSKKNKLRNSILGMSYFDYQQLLISDTLVNNLVRGFLSTTLPINQKLTSQISADYARFGEQTLISCKATLQMPIKKSNLNFGLNYLRFGSAYWCNLMGGLTLDSESPIKLSVSIERTIYSNTKYLFNGQLQLNYAF